MSLSPNSAIATLQALMQGGQGQAQAPDPTQAPNPLAQMMGQAPPQIQQPDPSMTAMQPPQVPGQPPAPGNIPDAGGDPLDAQIKALQQQVQDNIKKLQEPIQSQIPPELTDFDKYNEAKYQQTYGGGGVLGTAGRAVANLLSGYLHKGQSIRDTLTEQNRKDWQAAVSAEAQRVQLQKAQLAQATQLQAQELGNLRLQQQAQQAQVAQANAIANTNIKAQETPGAKDDAAKKQREDFIQSSADAGRPLTADEAKYYRANGKLPTTAEQTKNLPGFSTGAQILGVDPEAKVNGKPLDPKQFYKVQQKGNETSYFPTTPGQTIPITTNGVTTEMMLNGDGQLVPVTKPSTSTHQGSTPGAPGTTAAPVSSVGTPTVGAPISGAVKLSANDIKKTNDQIVSYDAAKSAASTIKSHLDLLNNSVEVEKLKNSLNPNKGPIAGLIARNTPLNKDETELVAAMRQLTESVNVLREPLGAMGFRSHDAYSNLTALAGQLRDNPKVTSSTLDKTIAIIDGLKANANKALGKTTEAPKTAKDFFDAYDKKK